MAYTAHANTHACREISGGLTFGLLPSMLSCISCATVCSRILFSSACCRRSFISSRVSSSGCKGGREGHTATMKHGHTTGGCGRGKERTHQDRRFRGVRLPLVGQLLYVENQFMQLRTKKLFKVLSSSPTCNPLIYSRQKTGIYYRTQWTLHQLHEDTVCGFGINSWSGLESCEWQGF